MELNKIITETKQQFSDTIYQELKFCKTKRAKFKKNQVIIIPDLNNKNAVIINTRKKQQKSRQKPRIYK